MNAQHKRVAQRWGERILSLKQRDARTPGTFVPQHESCCHVLLVNLQSFIKAVSFDAIFVVWSSTILFGKMVSD